MNKTTRPIQTGSSVSAPSSARSLRAAVLFAALFLCALPAPAVFADVPGVSREARQRAYEQRKKAEMEARLEREATQERVDAWIRGGVGEIEMVFQLAGPGACEYTLRGPRSGGGPGPVAAKGRSKAMAGPGKGFLMERAVIPPALGENEEGIYRLDAVCRLKVVEKTNFGPKETNREEELRVTREFRFHRESSYRVNQVKR